MEQAIQLERGNPRTYILRAELHISESDFEAEQKDLDKALNIAPNHAGAFAALAELNFYMDKEEDFYTTFEKVG